MFRWIERHRFGVDLMIAALCALIFVVPYAVALIHTPAWKNAGWLIVAVLFVVAIVLRRVHPWIAICIAWGASIFQMVAGFSILASNVLVFFVLASVTTFGSRVLRWVALGMAIAGGVVAGIYLGYVQPFANAAINSSGTSGASSAQNAGQGSDVTPYMTSTLVYAVTITALLVISWLIGFVIHLWNDYRGERITRVQIEADQRMAERLAVDQAERAQIAREMHDILAHSLAVIVAQSDGARMLAKTGPVHLPQTIASLQTISDVSRKALNNVRGILEIIRGDEEPSNDGPGIAALPELYASFRASGITVGEQEQGSPRQLNALQELVVYRVIQEALTNALRHGGVGTNVDVLFSWKGPDTLSVVIVNDNRGHNPLETGSGYGQRGMRERAASVGATIAVAQRADTYAVTLAVPMQADLSGQADVKRTDQVPTTATLLGDSSSESSGQLPTNEALTRNSETSQPPTNELPR